MFDILMYGCHDILKVRREKALSEIKRKERKRKKKRKKRRREKKDEVDDKTKKQKKKSREDDGKSKFKDDVMNTNCQLQVTEKKDNKINHSTVKGILLKQNNDEIESPVTVTVRAKELGVQLPVNDSLIKCDKKEFDPNSKIETPPAGGVLETESESEYRKLIANWAPPPNLMVDIKKNFEAEEEEEEEEWLSLSSKKKKEKEDTTKSKTSQEASKRGSSSSSGSGGDQGIQIQPCARYLPDADIYALPYTLPF